MSKFKLKNRQDIKAESITGVRFEFDDGVWFQSLRAGGSNAKYTAALSVMQQKLMREFGARTVPRDRLRAEQAKLYADTCLMGWGGVIDESGQPVPFSPSMALALLTDPELDTYWLEYDGRVADPRNFLVDAAAAVGESAEGVGQSLGN